MRQNEQIMWEVVLKTRERERFTPVLKKDERAACLRECGKDEDIDRHTRG